MNKAFIFLLAVVVMVFVLYAGLLPLPGQDDNVTPHSQPSPPGESPVPTPPREPSTLPEQGK